MATPNPELIAALNQTADRLALGAKFQWGHYGECNCGHLAQTLTGHSPRELLEFAQEREGEWWQQARDYCDTSGYSLHKVIGLMLQTGLDLEDLVHLEYLDDPDVLRAVPADAQPLERNRREHAVLYLRAWAQVLEDPSSAPPAPRAEPHPVGML